MMYETMFKAAQDAAMQKQSTGYISPEDTVCVIYAASTRMYVGVNHSEMQNGMTVNVHAEIDAVRKMLAGGDTAAQYLLLISVMTRQPMLPCNGCIGFILTQGQDNANCQVVLPDRMIPIMQIGQPAGGMPYNGAAPAGGSMYTSSMPYNGAAPAGGSMYTSSMPYGAAAPAGGSMYTSSMPYNGAAPAGGNSQYSSSMPYGSADPAGGHYVGVSIPAQSKSKNANAAYLKNKVGNLMSAGDDLDDDDDKEESSFFSRLFKK